MYKLKLFQKANLKSKIVIVIHSLCLKGKNLKMGYFVSCTEFLKFAHLLFTDQQLEEWTKKKSFPTRWSLTRRIIALCVTWYSSVNKGCCIGIKGINEIDLIYKLLWNYHQLDRITISNINIYTNAIQTKNSDVNS